MFCSQERQQKYKWLIRLTCLKIVEMKLMYLMYKKWHDLLELNLIVKKVILCYTMSKSTKIWVKKDINMKNMEFNVSRLFTNIGVIMFLMKTYEIRHDRTMKKIKNNKDRFQVVCMNLDCLTWRMTYVKLKSVSLFIVKECYKERKHNRNYTNRETRSSFVAKKNISFFKEISSIYWKKV